MVHRSPPLDSTSRLNSSCPHHLIHLLAKPSHLSPQIFFADFFWIVYVQNYAFGLNPSSTRIKSCTFFNKKRKEKKKRISLSSQLWRDIDPCLFFLFNFKICIAWWALDDVDQLSLLYGICQVYKNVTRSGLLWSWKFVVIIQEFGVLRYPRIVPHKWE